MASESKLGRAVLAVAAVVVLLAILFWVLGGEDEEKAPDFMGRVPTAERGSSGVDEAEQAGAPGQRREPAPQGVESARPATVRVPREEQPAAEGPPSGQTFDDYSSVPRREREGYDTPQRGLDEPTEGEIASLRREMPLEPPPDVVEELRRREAEAEPSQEEIDEIIRRSEAVQPTPEEIERAERAGAVEPSPERLRELREELREFEAQTP